MTEKEIKEAKELRASGMTYSEIGTKLGYSQTYISRKISDGKLYSKAYKRKALNNNQEEEIEVTANSHPGKEVQDVEKKLKVWLKKEVELLPHRTERWNKKKKNIKSLKQLKEESGVETSIF